MYAESPSPTASPTTIESIPQDTTGPSAKQVTGTLVLTCLVVATMTSLGAPLLPSIAHATHVSLATAQWILTAALLTGGLATPIMGHLADGPRQRAVVLTTLVILVAGSLLAVLTTSFPLLVVARALQGCGFGVVPVTMAIARRHLPPEKATRTVATLSVTTAVGVGLGYPMSGLLDTTFGYRSAFWLGVGVAVVALGFGLRYLPRDRAGTGSATLDPWSTGLMIVSLSGLILTLSQGDMWGLTSVAVLTTGPVSVVLLVVWVRRELLLSEPLVDFRLVRNRTVLTADISTLLVSASMYLYLPVVVDIVQSAPDHGQGLGESVLVSGLVLLPMSTCTLLASLSLARLARVTGPRALVPIGSLAFAVAMVFFAFEHSELWEAFASMSVLGIGCGLTFAAMPRMIVSTMPAEVTGHAMGLYQVLRGIGMAMGSALCGVLIAAYTHTGDALPTLGGYRASLLAGASLCVLTAVMSYVLPSRGVRAPAPTGRLVDEPVIANAAELGGLT